MIIAEDVFTAIFERLDADTILRQSDRLTAAGRIHKTPNVPTGAPKPCLTLNFIGDAFIGEQDVLAGWLLRTVFYAPAFSARDPDSKRARAVIKRMDELLYDVDFSHASVSRIIIKKPKPNGSPFSDPGAPHEHFWLNEYEVMAG